MALIVQKYGGTSVGSVERIQKVAENIARFKRQGHQLVVAVSAQAGTTDNLIKLAQQIDEHASAREMDMLLATGEQISIALLAIALNKMGIPAVSLTGHQAGILTDGVHMKARILEVEHERINQELTQGKVIIVAGFQGISADNNITTLGRGGSDTTAVAIAASLKADLCEIYTDVDGIYTADPRIVSNPHKLKTISYDEMLELATLGAQVLNNRSVEMAKKYNIELEVLSSLTKAPGTIVKEAAKVEKMLISGVAKDTNVARISIIGVPDRPGLAFKIFSKLSAKDINVDIILQSIGRHGTKDISFTVTQDKMKEAIQVLEDYKYTIDAENIVCDDKVAKVSIVGAGMETHAGIAAKMFEAMFDAQINIQMIATSEIKISVLIDVSDADRAVNAIHNKFFPSEQD